MNRLVLAWRGEVRVQREVDAEGEDQEEDIVQHHQLEAHFEIAEEPGDTLGRSHVAPGR
jgi:hypothetical protein